MILKHFNEPENQILAETVNQLRGRSEENEIYFQQTKRIWDNAAETKRLEGLDVEKSVRNFRLRLEEATYVEPKRFFSWTKVAAAAVVVIAVGIWIYSKETAVNYIVKNTSSAIDSVLLNDGSKVILAANSTIRYPEKFTDDIRPLDLLKGKAFFLVAKDSKRPFEVAIGNSTVKVLGTSFNINYSESSIDLSVQTGKVMFTPNEKSKPSILEAGQGLNYRYVENTLQMNKDDNAAAWFTKELRFVDMPLDEVCKQLSEYYGVHIELHDRKLTVKKFNANFKNTSLEEALTALKETYSIKIKREDQTIIIKSL
jgi:transmembrane sensor